MALFSIASILPDTGLLTNLDDLFTMEEWRSYWQTQNLRQYMSKSSAPVGRMLPVAISWPLLSDFIYTTDEVIKASLIMLRTFICSCGNGDPFCGIDGHREYGCSNFQS